MGNGLRGTFSNQTFLSSAIETLQDIDVEENVPFAPSRRAVLQYRRHVWAWGGPLPVRGLLQGREDRPGIPLT